MPILGAVRQLRKPAVIFADLLIKSPRASVPIQHFLAYRIKSLSRSWILFAVISILSLAQGAVGIAGGILATLNSE